MCTATSASQKSLSGCYRRLTECLFMHFCRQGCATSCCTTSKLKGRCHCTFGRKRLFLLTTARAFLDANWRWVWGGIRRSSGLGRHTSRSTQLAHAWNASPRMHSKTSTHVYILMTIGTTMNGVVFTRKRRECSPEGMAHHRRKFSMFEDGFNRRWKDECTVFGRWLTFDESHVVG